MGKIGKVFLGLFIFGFACYLITRMSGPLISSANSNGNTIGAGIFIIVILVIVVIFRILFRI